MTHELLATRAIQTAFLNASEEECNFIVKALAEATGAHDSHIYMALVNLWILTAGKAQDAQET